MEYRLLAVGSTVVDVVAGVGGYLFDKAMAGWRVTAAVGESSQGLPLDILGVTRAELPSALAALATARSAGMVVVCATLYESDVHIRSAVAAADVETLLWQSSADAQSQVSHQLSHAAGAFKQLALAAVNGSAAASPCGRTESFRVAVPARKRCRA